MMCALVERQRSGRGQVVDAAMVDGAATLMTSLFGMIGAGMHTAQRGTNLLDTGAPHYDVYRCADGEYVAVAPIEDKFRAILIERLGIEKFPDVTDRANWPKAKAILTETFAQRSRQDWCDLLEGSDACFAPVLSMDEAPAHAHNIARQTFLQRNDAWQPAPAPRFSRTTAEVRSDPPSPGEHSREALMSWGFEAAEVERLIGTGAVSEGAV